VPYVRLSRLVSLALLVLVAACGPSRPAPRSTPGAPAPSAAVERFMRLASEKDYGEMGWLFGTAQGAVMRRDPPKDVERRMYALATILEHQSYTLAGEEPIPGRLGMAVRVNVRVTQRGRTAPVPFVLVKGPEGRWYVEEIGVQALTFPR